MDEKEQIAKAASGDIAAFESLIRAYESRIYNIVIKQLGNEEDAGDVTQETLLKIYRALPAFKQESRFSTWIYRIAINACYDFLRTRTRRARLEEQRLDADSDRFAILPAGEESQPEHQLEQKQRKQALYQALDQLSPEQRLMIILRDIQGFSYEEIAAITTLPAGTVKSRISRARSALRQRLLEGNFFDRQTSKE